MIQLRGHTALITGGTQGVGRAIAIALATAGADVVIHGYQLDDHSEETRTACEKHGVKVSLIDGDLSGPTIDSVSRLFQRSIAVAPSIDILVNNAGTYIDKPFLEMDFET
ncbi:MAG: 3-oxoacyl-[acyl-carrier-protein] reductase FabG, partial [Planctomycetota bacterium]